MNTSARQTKASRTANGPALRDGGVINSAKVADTIGGLPAAVGPRASARRFGGFVPIYWCDHIREDQIGWRPVEVRVKRSSSQRRSDRPPGRRKARDWNVVVVAASATAR